MRVVSLVPSVTDTVALLGRADVLVGVTEWCTHGAPDAAARLGGTKNPDVEGVLGLAPDLVIANAEENRPPDLEALAAGGAEVWTTHPRTVADARQLVADLGERLDAGGAASRMAADIDAARERAATRRPDPPLVALTLVWRKPWMALGPGTYADDLLATCGFANALAGWEEAYPRLDEGLRLGPEVVLGPSEPYEFSVDDIGPIRELVGDDAVGVELVDGQVLTWHGGRTAAGLTAFSDLAARLAALRHEAR